MKKNIFKTAAICAAATGLVLGFGANAAFAESMATDGYVTYSGACGPNSVTGELLGITGIDVNFAFMQDPENDPFSWTSPHFNNWANPTYQSSPNPYLFNYVYDKTGTSKKAVWNQSRTSATGFRGGPNTDLDQYGAGDETDDAVWEMLPDIVVGTGNNADYNSAAYAGAVSKKLGVNYSTIGVYVNGGSYAEYLPEYYNLAAAGDKVAADSKGTKKLRYGTASLCANRIEALVRGTQGYILKQLAKDKKEKKTIAIIGSVNDDGTFKLLGHAQAYGNGNRFLESVINVSNDLEEEVDNSTATVNDLKKCDLLILAGNMGNSIEPIMDALPADLLAKSFYQTQKEAAMTYFLQTRSPENFNAIPRILGCLYPEYVDQDDFVCFVSEQIYHIKSSALADYIDNAFDGVRNWDATGGEATNWTTADASTYNEATVEAKLVEGMNYLASLGDDCVSQLKPEAGYSNDWATSLYKLENATISGVEANYTYTGKAITPTVTVTSIDGKTLAANTDYTVSYSDNTNVGTATITVTGKGSYSGTASQTFTIGKEDISKAAVSVSGTIVYSGVAQTPAVSVTLSGTTLPASAYTVSYANNTNAGTATVTVTGTGNYTGTATGSFAIDKATQVISATPASKTFKATALAKKAKSFNIKATAATSVSFKSSSNKVTVTKAGKVTVKKGTKKGTYKITITAAEGDNYLAASKTITIKVK